jgi:ribosomal protein L37AE/L43A
MNRWCPECGKETEHRRVSNEWQCISLGCGYYELTNPSRRKCDTPTCNQDAVAMTQIAPGTNVWLCAKCMKRIIEERGGTLRHKI